MNKESLKTTLQHLSAAHAALRDEEGETEFEKRRIAKILTDIEAAQAMISMFFKD